MSVTLNVTQNRNHQEENKTGNQVERRAYSIRELAKAYSVSDSLIRLEIARKQLRTVRIGHRVLVPVEAVADWLREGSKR